MKKTYQKPEIMFEDFSLNTNIAGDCERIVGNPSKGTCGVKGSMPGLDLFSADVNGCGLYNEADQHDGYCYHVPIESKTLFNS